MMLMLVIFKEGRPCRISLQHLSVGKSTFELLHQAGIGQAPMGPIIFVAMLLKAVRRRKEKRL